MVESTNKRLRPATVGDTVLVHPIPDVDRGRGDHKNVKGVITAFKDGFYSIGTEYGKLESGFTRNQFSACSEKLLDNSAVPDNFITLREVARQSSSGTGKGFF